jgi:cobalamin biosynthesis protein CobD/CbiB
MPTPPEHSKFKPGESGNPNGRPRKLVSLLKAQGYKLSEINDTLMALLSMDMTELKEAFENPSATVLEKAVAGAIRKSIEKGSLYNIETIITRAMGKPKEQTEHSGTQTIKVVYERSNSTTGTTPQEPS